MASYREWPGGSRVDHNGFQAMLIATWGQFAWIVYDGHANPDSVKYRVGVMVPTETGGRVATRIGEMYVAGIRVALKGGA